MRWAGIEGDLGGAGRLAGVDFETTGLDPHEGRIVQVGVTLFDGPKLVDSYKTLVDPEGVRITSGAKKTNQLEDSDLLGYPRFAEGPMQRLAEMTQGRLVIAHRLPFDASFWAASCVRAGEDPPERQGACSKTLAAAAGWFGPLKDLSSRAAGLYGVRSFAAHDALDDSYMCVVLAKKVAWRFGGTQEAMRACAEMLADPDRLEKITDQPDQASEYRRVFDINGL